MRCQRGENQRGRQAGIAWGEEEVDGWIDAYCLVIAQTCSALGLTRAVAVY